MNLVPRVRTALTLTYSDRPPSHSASLPTDDILSSLLLPFLLTLLSLESYHSTLQGEPDCLVHSQTDATDLTSSYQTLQTTGQCHRLVNTLTV